MISLQHLLTHPDLYQNELKKRFKDTTLVSQIVETQSRTKPLQMQLEKLRQQKNDFNDIVIKLQDTEKLSKIADMKLVANEIKELEESLRPLTEQSRELLYQIPNLSWEGMPVAPDSDGNVETAVYGPLPEFDFEPKNYYELSVFERDYLAKKGVEASGFRGYYIQGELARFQQVLFQWTLNRLIAKGFNYVIPPVFVNEDVMLGTGFFPGGREDSYEIKDDNMPKFLPGTSEAALMFLHANEVLDLSEPKKLTAWTRCFRKEAGAYGKDTQGGIRVTQFEKIETIFICNPAVSYSVFEEMTNVFRETVNLLGLTYHELEVSSGDASNKNHRQIDIEAWFPAQNTFRELCSSSNCTDYQTRTLNIKTTLENGEKVYAHSLNCTGIVNRTLFAIMEQFQQKDGRIKVPLALIPMFGKEFLE